MAANDQAILDALTQLNNTMTRLVNNPGESLGSGGEMRARARSQNAEEKALMARMSKTQTDQAATFDQFNDLYTKQTRSIQEFIAASQLSSSAFQQALNNVDLEDLDTKFVDEFKSAMSGSNNSIVSQMGQNINSLTDVMQAELDLQAKQAFIGLRRQFDDGALTAAQFLGKVEDAGISVEKFDELMGEANDGLEEMERTTMDLSAAMTQASRTFVVESKTLMEKLAEAGRKSGAFAAAGMLANATYDAATAAAELGAGMNMIDAGYLGTTSRELSMVQAQHKQTIMATGQTFDEFNDATRQGVYGLRTLTGSLLDGVKINAQSMTTFRNLSGAFENQGDYMNDQQKLYKQMHDTFSMTSDQFNQFNEQMLNSTNVQSSLYRLNKDQRLQAFQDIQQTATQLRLQGMTNEEAQNVIEHFAEMSGKKDPLDVLRDAVKVQAFAGSMGMGAQGAEYARLARSGNADPAEMARLVREIDQAHQARMAGGTEGQRIAQYRVMSGLGVGDLFGSNGIARGLETRQDMAIGGGTGGGAKQVADAVGHLPEAMGAVLLGGDMMNSPLGKAIRAIEISTGITAASAGGSMLGGLRKGLNKIPGLGKNIMSLGRLGMMGTAGLAGTVGYGAYKGTTALLGKTDKDERFNQWLSEKAGNAPEKNARIAGDAETAKILIALQDIAKTNKESALYGKEYTELLEVATQVSKETKGEIKNQTDALAAVKGAQVNPSFRWAFK